MNYIDEIQAIIEGQEGNATLTIQMEKVGVKIKYHVVYENSVGHDDATGSTLNEALENTLDLLKTCLD